ncbi:hypothetical protein KTJ50_15865, partial [Acinetobacter lwoffii]|nr:hypothetical protein [Acinetobacter lwoffii]
MPIPTPADFRNKSKKHSEVREMLAQMAGNVDRSYNTLAEANANIANISLNTKVSVLSETDGGDYYKATSNATSLTKSPYDPVNQSKDYTNHKITEQHDLTSSVERTLYVYNVDGTKNTS